MVQRLNSAQAQQIVLDCVPLGFTELRYPEPVSVESIRDFSRQIAESPFGRCYGLFTADLQPRGLLAGMIMPDPLTGVPIGMEQLWWAAKGADGRELIHAFEDECRSAGCVRLITGYSEYVNPKLMARMYRGLGYKLFSTSVAKELLCQSQP